MQFAKRRKQRRRQGNEQRSEGRNGADAAGYAHLYHQPLLVGNTVRGGRAASRIQSTDAIMYTRHTAVSPSRGIENREGGFLAQEPDEDVGGLVCSAENWCIKER